MSNLHRRVYDRFEALEIRIAPNPRDSLYHAQYGQREFIVHARMDGRSFSFGHSLRPDALASEFDLVFDLAYNAIRLCFLTGMSGEEREEAMRNDAKLRAMWAERPDVSTRDTRIRPGDEDLLRARRKGKQP